MPRHHDPRFVHEFVLAPTPAQVRILAIRLELGRQLYNAMLGKARARLNRCKRLHAWKEAMALFKQARACAKRKDEVGAKALRTEAKARQQAAIHQVMLEERERYAPDSKAKADRLKDPAPGIMTRLRRAHLRDHLDFKSVQGLATRAYQTADQLRFKRPTTRKDGSLKFPRVHFLRKDEVRAIDSTSIHWRGDKIEWNSPLHKLQIPVVFDRKDRKGVQAHALAQMQDTDNICESMRVLTRTVRDETRWYCQVTLKGAAKWKEQYPPGHGKTVGIDFGPSQIAIMYQENPERDGKYQEKRQENPERDGKYQAKGEENPERELKALRGAKLELAEGLRHDYARIRRIQRYLDRSRRATNPDNYNPDGTIKRTPGQRLIWHESRRYQKAQTQLADLWRQYAARRKNQLGRLANQIIARGTTIKIEQLSYKAWQKTWGKSIGRGAPGLLVAMLRQKAEQCGGALIEFPTRHTKFSQLCHGCGTYTKKPLQQRIHRCDCGIGPLDRDIYSAFLAFHYDLASKDLDIGAARAAFTGLQSGAVDIQGLAQAACIRPSVGDASPQAKGDCGGSSATRALLLTEALADEDAGERLESNPPFQGSTLSAQPASITAGSPSPDDARRLEPEDSGSMVIHEGEKIAPRKLPRQECSQSASQLPLFPGDSEPTG